MTEGIFYNFGNYTFRISGDIELLRKISGSFTSYNSTCIISEYVNLELRVNPITINGKIKNNWHYSNYSTGFQAIYCANGQPRFSIHITHDLRNAIITIPRKHIYILKIAIQYSVMLILSKQCVGLHGVSVMCDNQVIVLSAPSGTGKTTLARLLHEYCNATIINGDFALLEPLPNGKVLFIPTPFCGSSQECVNSRFHINRIVFLAQSHENIYECLSVKDSVRYMLCNCFIPEWSSKLNNDIQKTVFNIIESLPINRYSFYPEKSAALLFRSLVSL